MSHYLMEFRFQGIAKKEIKRLIYEVDKKFRLEYARKKRPIPHVTIVAPFNTRNQKKLVQDFKSVCSQYDFIKFNIRGFGHFDDSKVVYVNIEPSVKMKDLRKDLIKKIKKYSTMVDYDGSDNYKAHATIAMKIPPKKFGKIKRYIHGKKRKPSRNFVLVRATLIKNKKILYEYDFLLKRLLNRGQAKNKKIYTKTLKKLMAPSQKTIAEELGLLSKLKRLFLK